LSCELINIRRIRFFHSNFITLTYAYAAYRNFILRSYDVNRHAANVKEIEGEKERTTEAASFVMTLASGGARSLQFSLRYRRRSFDLLRSPAKIERTSSNRIDQKVGMNPLSRSIPRRTCIVSDALLLDLRKAVATTVVPLRSEVRKMRRVAGPSLSLFE